jgi:regulator of sigma E protease
METFLWTLLLLGVLIFIHELGHFLAAKWAGIAVPRFSLGLGPRLVGFRIGETDYCLSAIPFGGYVKMAGVEGEEENWMEGDELRRGGRAARGEGTGEEEVAGFWMSGESLEGDDASDAGAARRSADAGPDRGFDSKPLWVRLVVILAGVTMNFLFGFVIFVWLSWHQGEARLPTIVSGVDSTVAAVEPRAREWRGRSIAAVNGEPVTSWTEVVERLNVAASPVRLAFRDAGEVALAPSLSGEELAAGLTPGLPPVVGEVQEGGPAEGAGLLPGDRILALDGQPVLLWDDITTYVRERAGREIRLRVQRDERPGRAGGERTLEIAVVPRRERAPGDDNRFIEVGYLGVAARIETRALSPVEALVQGSLATWRAGGLIVDGLRQLVTGSVSFDSIGGPVAIGQITGYYQRLGFDQLLWWMGLFSINLAILNLLPIPVLDGGHVVFFLGTEALRGRPLSTRSKIRLSLAGWVVIGLLMAWAVTSDIQRLIGRL